MVQEELSLSKVLTVAIHHLILRLLHQLVVALVEVVIQHHHHILVFQAALAAAAVGKVVEKMVQELQVLRDKEIVEQVDPLVVFIRVVAEVALEL